ncbi:fibroblast growth factor-binding protein 3 [Camarhynchus parvulus]|uniref:fibroblast growth factor-binding protein 3 n=1 Tax=Geospiza parvula TaxID=87175 RepID=UPI001237B4A2|nr:fibroblast growth factor-binding protein 3 [Camarhynchus parvulus]
MRPPLALLALAALGAAAGGAEREAAEEARTGRFSTPERHRCRWELRSAAGASELRLSCRAAGGGAARSCAYRGEPRRCPAFGARSRHYWRQILSRLRRRRHPCAPGAPLSARPAARAVPRPRRSCACCPTPARPRRPPARSPPKTRRRRTAPSGGTRCAASSSASGRAEPLRPAGGSAAARAPHPDTAGLACPRPPPPMPPDSVRSPLLLPNKAVTIL